MDGQMTGYLLMALIIGALIVIGILGPRYKLRRAARQLVGAFRALGATSPSKGATLEQLGLTRKNPFDGMLKGRDYRPHALRLLREANIVRATKTGTLYLAEDQLERSPLKGPLRIR